MSKSLTRTKLRLLLKTIPKDELNSQSLKVSEGLSSIIKKFHSFACYMSMENGEICTDRIIEGLFKERKRVYLPRCTTTKQSGQEILISEDRDIQHHLTFHLMSDFEQVRQLKPSGKYKIREPKEEITAPLPPTDLDIMLVPGMAFDLYGGRLGHGAGYYDDFVRRFEHYNKRRPLLIGVALTQQILPEVPMEAHDVHMDCILTGDGKLHWIKSDFLSNL